MEDFYRGFFIILEKMTGFFLKSGHFLEGLSIGTVRQDSD